jgi:ADP-ribosyl-[dinitrogen reductase] hydrolase
VIYGTDNYEDCVRAAIQLGNDTDTTACIAGGIAGLLYGYEGIPERWKSKLRGDEILAPLLSGLREHVAG